MTLRLLLFLISAFLAVADDDAPSIEQLMRAGEASYAKADYEGARVSYEKAWELAQQAAPKDPVRYDILRRLTAVRAAVGEFADADRYLQLAINWRETAIGRDDPRIADDLLASVAISRGMNDLDRALAILERVRFMHVRDAGAESAPVASDLSLMGQILLDQKKLEGAAESWTAALKIREKAAGRYDVSLLGDLDRLGQALVTLNRYDQAENAYRRTLVIRESVLGRNSSDLLPSIDGLAYALFGQKKYDEADPLYHRLIALWTAYGGKEHPMVAMAYDKVAVFYADQKKYEESKAAAEHGNAIRAHFLAMGLAQEANQQQVQGNVDAAKDLYQRALAALDPPNPVYDDLHASIASILKTLEAPPASKPKPPRPPARRK